MSQRFAGREDFARAALASANAPPIASLRPAIRYAGAWCADGVQRSRCGVQCPTCGAAAAAPRETVNGAAALPWNHIYAAWNWPSWTTPVYDAPLTPTAGGPF